MAESTTAVMTPQFSPRAGLAAVGLRLRSLDLFGPIRQRVRIAQKTVKHTPTDKRYDASIAMLAGAHGPAASNTRLRGDAAVQAAFGRRGGAEQAVVQETVDACTAEDVRRLDRAVAEGSRRPSRGYRHAAAAGWQRLDADRSGRPCGPKAARAAGGAGRRQPLR